MTDDKPYWETTQDVLQPLIARPQLTEKLLKKPPFRFIHDIFTNLTLSCGLGAGLLEGSEADAMSFTEKSAKAACLAKIVEYVTEVNKKPIDVDPRLIVNGKEPERTNVLLQDLATAAKAGKPAWDRALDALRTEAAASSQGPPKQREPEKEQPRAEPEAPPPPPPPPPPQDTPANPAASKKRASSSAIVVDTTAAPAPGGVPAKPADWEQMLTRTAALRERAEGHGTDVTGCRTFSNKALGAEILEIQKEITEASKAPTGHPLSKYDLPDEPEDVEKLLHLIEEQFALIRPTNDMMQENEQILDQLTKAIIPQG
ncbi:hypothetical protein DIPPA_23779 [Diplonema papillatum]|nr:hypothetical protein DIPPA_23779 [Diplonema papillatum]